MVDFLFPGDLGGVGAICTDVPSCGRQFVIDQAFAGCGFIEAQNIGGIFPGIQKRFEFLDLLFRSPGLGSNDFQFRQERLHFDFLGGQFFPGTLFFLF